MADLRERIHWVSLGGREPLHEVLKSVRDMFKHLDNCFEDEVAKRMAGEKLGLVDVERCRSTWTYLTTDQHFGSLGQRIFSGYQRNHKSRKLWS